MNFETYQLDKRLDSFNYQQAQADILPILERGSNVVLDMTACKYISSAGLKLCLVGISEEVKDIMDVTGFNTFFETFSTMEECLEKMKE